MTDPLNWRVSRFTNNGQCVEVADAGDAVLVRNSNHRAGGTLALDPASMAGLVQAVKAGRLDDHA